MSRLEQGERIYDLDKDFSHNSAMSLSLDLETWYKVTAYPLLKDSLWMKFEPDWVKGRVDMLQTNGHEQTDGLTH